MNKLKVILVAFVVLIVALQFFQISKVNPASYPEEDFMKLTAAPPQIQTILKNACYDCHSYQTIYPWYAYINPIGSFIGHHVEEGRSELNFSIWGTYEEKKQIHKVEECVQELEKNKMPLKSYIFAHPQADLSQEDKTALITWFKTLIH